MPPTTRKSPQDRQPAKKTTAKKTTTRQPRSRPVEPQPHDANDKYAVSTWGSDLGGAEDLKVPSGQLCLVQRPGIQGLMEAGILRDLDSLTALVDSKHVKRVRGPGRQMTEEVDVASLMQDEGNLANLMHVVDRVICHVVLKPSVQMKPNDPTTRKAGIIYTDMIDLVDKMFIFQFAVGGTRGLESFREQLNSALGSVDA